MSLVNQVLAELGLIRPLKKPDFDNLAKTYSDMTQGILLFDDALIIEGISRKWYSCKPRIENILDCFGETRIVKKSSFDKINYIMSGYDRVTMKLVKKYEKELRELVL